MTACGGVTESQERRNDSLSSPLTLGKECSLINPSSLGWDHLNNFFNLLRSIFLSLVNQWGCLKMKLKRLSRQSKSSSTGSSIGRSQVQCSQASYCNDLLIKVLVAGSNNENAIFRLPQHNVICKMPTDNVTFANNLETERCSHEAVYFSVFTAETK